MKDKIAKISSFLLIFILFSTVSFQALAQTPGEHILKKKAQFRLQKIIKHTNAVTGLVSVDLTTGKTSFAFHPDFSFPQASAIKIPLLMTLFKQAKNGKISLSDKRTIHESDVVGGTGILKSMKMPVTLSIHNLCILMMFVSDNTATNSLIDLVGMKNVNANMRSLGLKKTRLQRKMMDIKASARGQENLSTPAEAARILKMLYHGKYISQKISSEIISFMKNTDRSDSRLAAGLPDDVPIAFKPGGLKGVATEWALVLLPERPYAVALMQSYSTPDEKGQNIKKISGILYRYYWKLGNSTKYGVYRNPKLIKK
jgi:beta-lactamase class A